MVLQEVVEENRVEVTDALTDDNNAILKVRVSGGSLAFLFLGALGSDLAPRRVWGGAQMSHHRGREEETDGPGWSPCGVTGSAVPKWTSQPLLAATVLGKAWDVTLLHQGGFHLDPGQKPLRRL